MLSVNLHFSDSAKPYKIEAFSTEGCNSLVVTDKDWQQVTMFFDSLLQLQQVAQGLALALETVVSNPIEEFHVSLLTAEALLSRKDEEAQDECPF